MSGQSPVRFYGQYLVEVPALPDSEQQRRHYDEVLSRLARERQYGIVRRLYPRLPGADRSAMASVSLPAPKQVAYRPVTWALQRSEEHTSELQSLMRISYAVFCLKKKKTDSK